MIRTRLLHWWFRRTCGCFEGCQQKLFTWRTYGESCTHKRCPLKQFTVPVRAYRKATEVNNEDDE